MSLLVLLRLVALILFFLTGEPVFRFLWSFLRRLICLWIRRSCSARISRWLLVCRLALVRTILWAIVSRRRRVVDRSIRGWIRWGHIRWAHVARLALVRTILWPIVPRRRRVVDRSIRDWIGWRHICSAHVARLALGLACIWAGRPTRGRLDGGR